jgi:hypothetical protein
MTLRAAMAALAAFALGGIPGWTVVGTGDFDGNGVPDLVWQNDTTRQVNQCFLWLYLQFHDLQIQYRDAAEHRNPQHLRKIREPSLMPSLRVVHGQLSDSAPGAPACYRWLPSFGEEM